MGSRTFNSPIFVAGPPRSGTTLIQLLISAHENIYTLPETHFFTYVKDVVGDEYDKEYVPAILQALSQKPGIIFNKLSFDKINKCIEKTGINDGNVLNCIIQEFKTVNELDGTRWLEKTPRHILKLEKIEQFWPDARIIVVVRDPRGAISSFHSKREFPSKYSRYMDLFKRIDAWKACIAAMNNTKTKYKQIRYESFIADPQHTLEDLMVYVGEKQQAHQLTKFSDNFSTATLKSETHKQLNDSLKIVDRTMIWMERLTPTEIRWIEYLCSTEMSQLFYRPTSLIGLPMCQLHFYLLYRVRNVLTRIKQWILG